MFKTPLIVFLMQCPDQKGLVAAVSGFFYKRGFNILRSQQYTDAARNIYYMRLELDLRHLAMPRLQLEEEFSALAKILNMKWTVNYSDLRPRVAILATKAPHCLYDLLQRQKERELECDFPLIVSNHAHLEEIANMFRVPFRCLPVGDDRNAQERRMLELLKAHHIDLVILARYMQILSKRAIDAYPNSIINIHHAFLPAFQGAYPYRQAYERGVKMIGATAHYATENLDQGPIIEQDAARVTHEQSPRDLEQIGRDIERVVLARAVKAHLERRVVVSENRVIVF